MNKKLRFSRLWMMRGLLTLATGFLHLSNAQAQQHVVEWVQRYTSLSDADANDYAQKVVTDSANNVIVVGYTETESTGDDWIIIKYSGAGVALWTNRYDGPGNGNDQAKVVAVNISGNVFVAGSSHDADSLSDYATVAYSSAGVSLWTNFYNGPDNDADIPCAMAIDGAGNVVVTGSSQAGGSSDYATIAYSTAGVALWTNHYNGPGNGNDIASAIVVDANDNVVVTGQAFIDDYNYADYATVAYSGTGEPLWTNFYDGQAIEGTDVANGIAADSNGNVFVTGYSLVSGTPGFATVAYSSEGNPIWTNLYPTSGSYVGATAVAVDDKGDVFVTGVSIRPSSGPVLTTVAYSNGGLPLWTNYFGGPEDAADTGVAIAVAFDGNIIVAGRSGSDGAFDYAIVAYSNAGLPLWTNLYDGPAGNDDLPRSLALGNDGTVFVTGSSWSGISHDFATVAYSWDGMSLWTNRFNLPGSGSDADDEAVAMILDGEGNVFVTGDSWINGSSDYATVAYSGTGMGLWTNYFNGPGDGADLAKAIAVDNSGNVFVTGISFSNNVPDYATVAYSGAGVPLWTNLYDGRGNAEDFATALAADGDGNVFVTGYSWSGDSYDYATIAYSSAGVALWTNLYDGLGNGDDLPSALAVDTNGNVFVTGYSWSGDSSDYATIAYSSAGVVLWTNLYDGRGSSEDYATALVVEEDGNVFVTGYSWSGNSDDYATIAYSSSGVALWTNLYDGPGNGDDRATALAVDANGNVFVTGYSWSGDSSDYVTIAYSSAGTPLSTNTYGAPLNESDYAAALALDSNGNVFVTGSSYSIGFAGDIYFDYATVAYSASGVPLWTNRFDGAAQRDDFAVSVRVDPNGSVVVAGYSYGSTGASDYVTIKYSPGERFPRLNFQVLSDQLVLNWTNAVFGLQSAPTFSGSYTNIPNATSPYTNPFSGADQYFRLRAD